MVPLPGNVTDTITPDGSTTVTWAYPDLHGNTTVISDNSGTRLGHVINYDPWGQPLADPVDAANGAVTSNFTTNATSGKITDHSSGITIMGARPYAASEARFLTVDPIEGGCANNYTYSFGDPFTRPDLSGRSSCWRSIAGALFSTVGTGLGIASIYFPEFGILGKLSLLSSLFGLGMSGDCTGKSSRVACGLDIGSGTYGFLGAGLSSLAKAADSQGGVVGGILSGLGGLAFGAVGIYNGIVSAVKAC